MMKLLARDTLQFPPSPLRGSFGREWLKAPLRMGAVAPSSSALARAITQGLSVEDGPIIELGPGTGVFTAAILARGVPPRHLSAIEMSEDFACSLAEHYREVIVIRGDAAHVRHLTPFGPAAAGTIVCGLPLLTMPPAKVLRILAGSFAALRPDGAFRLFTYGPFCSVPDAVLKRLCLTARRTAFVGRNIPPASVYILERKPLAGLCQRKSVCLDQSG